MRFNMSNSDENIYRYDIPDYLLGKTSPETSAMIESLMASNPEFKAEVDEFSKTMEEIGSLSQLETDAYKAELPEGYFSDLSANVLRRIQDKPSGTKFLDELSSVLNSWFSPVPISEFSTAIAGFAVLIMIFSFIVTFQTETPVYSSRLSEESFTSYEENTALATLDFTQGHYGETMLFSLSYDDAETVLENLNASLTYTPSTLSDETSYEILSEEEANELLKYL